MALKQHEFLGALYLDAESFRPKAPAYGCKVSILELPSDSLEEIIALASRAVDAFCAGQGFDPDVTICENHDFNINTRIVRVNQPPVVDLLSYKIRTGPGTASAFQLTPVSTDANGNKIGWGAVFYNRQENYLELSALSVAAYGTSYLTSLGLMTPQVEIQYKNGLSVPKEVIAATAFQTAHLLNMAHLDNQVLPGVIQMSSPEFSLTRETGQRTGRTAEAMHPMAMHFLKKVAEISIA
ncbi:MAG: hypothetical protein ABI977_22085 [Acidobacteriota bacterium]